MNKVPVKIVQTQDMHGNKKISVMLDISYYKATKSKSDEKVRMFKELYFQLVENAKTIYKKSRKKRKGNTSYYYELSKLLFDFNQKTEYEFEITNYVKALQRDFVLRRSYVGVIMNFCRYFKPEEVLDIIPFSAYFELIIKSNKLQERGLFEVEKNRLIELGRSGKVPEHKKYRDYLRNLVNN